MPTGDAWTEHDPLREGEPWAWFDADDEIDIPHNVSAWMANLNSTYASHVLVLDDGLTQIATSYSAPNIIARIGTDGTVADDEKYGVTFRVTTANGQVSDKTLYLRIRRS